MFAKCFAVPLAKFILANPEAQGFKIEMMPDGRYEIMIVEAVMPSGAVKTKRIFEQRDGRERKVI